MPRPSRLVILPARGTLLVSTDLHGNLDDLKALQGHFERLQGNAVPAHWVLLGDLVHGPDDAARAARPELYGFPDDSPAVVELVAGLLAAWPGQVHLLLGNHDYGHAGGPPTSKFHPNEVAYLESRMSPSERGRMCAMFQSAALLAIAPCGVLLAHGSPDASLIDVHQVALLHLDNRLNSRHGQWLLTSLLTSYGQPDPVTCQVLECAGHSAGMTLGLVIHGHDRDEDGIFVEGNHQLCPVIFGAPRENKRYVVLDLAARYAGVHSLADGREIRRLYAP